MLSEQLNVHPSVVLSTLRECGKCGKLRHALTWRSSNQRPETQMNRHKKDVAEASFKKMLENADTLQVDCGTSLRIPVTSRVVRQCWFDPEGKWL